MRPLLRAFAPGLAAIGVIANLSRVMFAIGRLKVAAAALAGSWLLVIVADVVLAELAPPHLVVAALALGNTIGQTLVVNPLVIATRRIRGKAAVEGVVRAALASLAAGVAGSAAGLAVTLAAPAGGKLHDLGTGTAGAAVAIVAFGVVAYVLDGGEMRAALRRLRRLRRLARPRG